MTFSLSKKAILLIVCIAVIISLLAIVIYGKGIRDVIETQYKNRSVDIARLVATGVDTQKLLNVRQAVREIYDRADNKVMSDKWGTPEFEAYVSQFTSVEDMDDYKDLRADLRRMQDELDVDCLYITWLDVENECNVYLVDAAYEDACPVGCIDPIYLDDPSEFLKDPKVGLVPNITNTPEYGWLIATGMPILDETGEFIAISAVDISMNDVISQQNRLLGYVVLAFLGATLLVCVLGILLVNRVIVKPINKLSRAAAEYAQSRHNKKVFSELDISRGDEIGTLADSMAQMEEDIDGYIVNLERTTSDLIAAREHAEQMDRIANIDPLTKVRNKRAYDLEVKRLNEVTHPYGIAMIDLNGLKQLNDTYGHEKGDAGINALCQIICRVFKHSPVFRVGGDEFIVVLENNDLIERDNLVLSVQEIFRQNASDPSAEPWERVTAAIGYAVYDPEKDENADSVLARADEAMYENKKRLKEDMAR